MYLMLLFLSPAGLSHHKHITLKMDEAILTVNNELDTEVVVSWVSERCYQVEAHTHKYFPEVYSVATRLGSDEEGVLIVFLCASVCISSWGCYLQGPVLAGPVLPASL